MYKYKFKYFLLDLFCSIRHNLALRLLEGSLSLLYIRQAIFVEYFLNALLHDLSLKVSISNEISHDDSRISSLHMSFSVPRLDLNFMSLFKAKLCDLQRSLQNSFSTARFNSDVNFSTPHDLSRMLMLLLVSKVNLDASITLLMNE